MSVTSKLVGDRSFAGVVSTLTLGMALHFVVEAKRDERRIRAAGAATRALSPRPLVGARALRVFGGVTSFYRDHDYNDNVGHDNDRRVDDDNGADDDARTEWSNLVGDSRREPPSGYESMADGG